MKLSIILATQDFRGDHSADVRIAFDPVPGETVEQLIERMVRLNDKPLSPLDVIEIRPVCWEESVIEAPPSGLIR